MLSCFILEIRYKYLNRFHIYKVSIVTAVNKSASVVRGQATLTGVRGPWMGDRPLHIAALF